MPLAVLLLISCSGHVCACPHASSERYSVRLLDMCKECTEPGCTVCICSLNKDMIIVSIHQEKILTLPSECRSWNRDSPHQETFFPSSIIQFWWACGNSGLSFLLLAGTTPTAPLTWGGWRVRRGQVFLKLNLFLLLSATLPYTLLILTVTLYSALFWPSHLTIHLLLHTVCPICMAFWPDQTSCKPTAALLFVRQPFISLWWVPLAGLWTSKTIQFKRRTLYLYV